MNKWLRERKNNTKKTTDWPCEHVSINQRCGLFWQWPITLPLQMNGIHARSRSVQHKQSGSHACVPQVRRSFTVGDELGALHLASQQNVSDGTTQKSGESRMWSSRSQKFCTDNNIKNTNQRNKKLQKATQRGKAIKENCLSRERGSGSKLRKK